MISSILVFLLVLSILVLVHELGHFLVAKRFGVMVEEFGFGLPPRLFGKKIGETLYSINTLPFGGFVKLHGEDATEKLKNPKRSFLGKSKKVRMAIVVAGVVMNFILAIVAFGVVYSFSGIPRETKDVKIVDIAAGSPAQNAGLIVGDIVRLADKEKVESVNGFVGLVEKKKGEKFPLEVERRTGNKSSIKTVYLTARKNLPEGEGPLGVIITATEIYYPPVFLRPILGIYYGFGEAVFWGKNVTAALIGTIAGLLTGKVPQDIAGPVGIFAITSKAAQLGVLAVVNFVGIMSVNLAILNVLPFPALDGGRLLFIGIEKAIGRKVLPKVEAAIHAVGMIILLALLLAVTAHDIIRLITAGSISGFLRGVVK